MIRSSFVVCFLFYISSCTAQVKHFVDLSFGINQFDFFSGLDYSRSIGRSTPSVGLSVGVNRTFFQGRIYPRLNFSNIYYIIDQEKFKMGPSVRYGYSFLEVNRDEKQWHQWHEVMTGLRLKYGGKYMFTFDLQAGWMAERYHDQVSNSKRTHHFFGYWSSIGLSYAL
jgi:hypothetical protein